MTPAAAAILEGMPDPSLLHRADRDGTTWILAGSVVLACYPSADTGLRNVAVAVCRQLGFSGRAVAGVMGLTENYVATLHNRALREGTAGLVRAPGRPRKLAGNAWEQAARWRAGGASDSEIARRLQVAQSTVFRRLGPAAVQEQLPAGEPEPQAGGPEAGPAAPGPGEPAAPEPRPAAEPGPPAGAGLAPAGELVPLPAGDLAARPGGAPASAADGAQPSRYAGAMLAHAYYQRIGAEAILAAALPPALARPRYDDLALLTATSLAFRAGRLLRRGHQAPDPGPGRDPRRDRPAPRPAHAAAPAGRDRRGLRPAGPAAPARRGDAGRRRAGAARVLRRRSLRPLRGRQACPQGVEHQAPARPARPGRHRGHRLSRPGGVLRRRGTVRAFRHPPRRPGPAAADPRARRQDPARLRPRWLLPTGAVACPPAEPPSPPAACGMGASRMRTLAPGCGRNCTPTRTASTITASAAEVSQLARRRCRRVAAARCTAPRVRACRPAGSSASGAAVSSSRRTGPSRCSSAVQPAHSRRWPGNSADSYGPSAPRAHPATSACTPGVAGSSDIEASLGQRGA